MIEYERPDLRITLERITPEYAKSLLATSTGNPRWKSGKLVTKNNASKIARDIANGHWYNGNGTIGINRAGILKDGHTRLSAIIEAGIPVWCIIVRGITDEGEFHIDDNKARTLTQRSNYGSQVLNVPLIFETARRGVVYDRGLSDTDKILFIESHPAVNDAANLTALGSRHPVMRRGACVCGVMCAIEYGVSTIRLERFCRAVNSGFSEDGEDISPAVVLRNELLNMRGTGRIYDTYRLMNHTQAAIYDYINQIPRRRAYSKTEGYYFNANRELGDPRYQMD